MNSSQLRRWLTRRGCSFQTKRGTGHVIVRKGSRKSQLPVHGGSKQLGTGLVRKILRELGIDERPPR
jgi:mRNA interferase HicA